MNGVLISEMAHDVRRYRSTSAPDATAPHTAPFVLAACVIGGAKCSRLAVVATREMEIDVPLEGTNVQQGKDILASSGLAIMPADGPGRRGEKDCGRGEAGAVKAPG